MSKTAMNDLTLPVRPAPPVRPVKPALPALPDIPGVDYLQEREPKSRRLAGPFFLDQIERIVNGAQMARRRHKLGTLYIAPDDQNRVSFSIYKRRAA
jgi:hypothetical protein